ncbi:MAG: YybH family protein, partial [Longimicrobiales bacterium]
ARTGNWTEVASLYSEDAVLMPPNAEAEDGRDAVREHLTGFPPLQAIDFERVHIDGSGDLAYVQGRYTMTFAMPDGQTMEDRGKYIEIWERQDDGQWRITRDIFNSDLPAHPEM